MSGKRPDGDGLVRKRTDGRWDPDPGGEGEVEPGDGAEHFVERKIPGRCLRFLMLTMHCQLW